MNRQGIREAVIDRCGLLTGGTSYSSTDLSATDAVLNRMIQRSLTTISAMGGHNGWEWLRGETTVTWPTQTESRTFVQLAALMSLTTSTLIRVWPPFVEDSARTRLNPMPLAQLRQTFDYPAEIGTRRWKDPVVARTTGALAATWNYANGASGVGATLTRTTNGALEAQDGVTLVANDRLLVANQAAALQNGVYTVTTVGSGGAASVLTRATDCDASADLVDASVNVVNGTVYGDTTWVQATDTPVVGTDSIVWESGVTNTGRPEFCSIEARTVYVAPATDSAYTFRFRYLLNEKTLNHDTSDSGANIATPYMPDEFQDMLVEHVATSWYRRVQNYQAASIADQAFGQRLADARSAQRSAGGGTRVMLVADG